MFSPSLTLTPTRLLATTLGAVLTVALPVVQAAGPASDNAAAAVYNDGWQTGDNGGTGFNAWDLSNNNNGANGSASFAGYFIGDSTAGSGNINTAGKSFGIYANPGTVNTFATAQRTFSGGTLAVGQTFSLQLAVNFRNGSKGFNLRAGGTNNVFTFNVAGDNYTYQVNSGTSTTLSLGFQSDSVFTLSFNQVSASSESVTISRTSAGGGTETPLNQTFALSGITGFELFNSNTDDGSPQNNLFFNNLSVVPEPSTWALLGAGVLLLAGSRWRRAGA